MLQKQAPKTNGIGLRTKMTHSCSVMLMDIGVLTKEPTYRRHIYTNELNLLVIIIFTSKNVSTCIRLFVR